LIKKLIYIDLIQLISNFQMDGGFTDERLWMDKYQPKRIEELDYNYNITDILKTIAQKEDFPHLIFYGPEGAGKKTRIRALLTLLYGVGIHKVNSEMKEVKVNSTTVEYLITSSNYHIELTPSDAEHHDRIIIQKVIKESASVGQIDTKNQRNFKIIVLQEVDNLTKEAQAGLRRTMEKYMKSCRLIMSCNSLTKIIPPIRSRCLSIRVPSPSEVDIKAILTNIAAKEGINVNSSQIEMIIKTCDRNVRRAINCLQLSKIYIKLIIFLLSFT
jgi:replication factor C subunit 3/5